jgi:hypothetical protein
MIVIESFRNNIGDDFKFSTNLSNYIYSTLYIYCTANGINILDSNIIQIKGGKIIQDLEKAMEESLTNLLKSCYSSPSETDLNTSPNRFEKIQYKNMLYTLNYRISPNGFGLLAFSLFHLIEFLNGLEYLAIETKDLNNYV